MDRRNFLRLAGGGVVLAAASGCSRELPPAAIAAWQGPPSSEADPRRWALSYALLAPNSHNLQSWRADLRTPGEILLHVDLGRLLPETDPQGRQMLVSQGTFLELLDLAARERGQRAEITLFPQGAFAADRIDARPVAHIRLVPDAAVARDPLFGQILKRHTNREAYAPDVPPPAALQATAAAAQAPGLRAGFTSSDAAELDKHRRIAAEAWRIELTTVPKVMESYGWLRIGPAEIERHRDGITMNDPLMRAITAVGLFDRTKPPQPDDRGIAMQVDDFGRKLAATPAFFWLVSEGNDRATQVRAGRAYMRAQLAATAQGLAMQPLSQALQEYPEVAGPYADIHALLRAPRPQQTVQMWVRLGRGPQVEPAPRRGLQAHLI